MATVSKVKIQIHLTTKVKRILQKQADLDKRKLKPYLEKILINQSEETKKVQPQNEIDSSQNL